MAEPIIEIHYLDGRIESNPTNLSGVQQAISSDLESVEINGVPFIPPAGVEPAHMV